MESVAVRTLMSLRVFHNLPDEGSISLTDLSAKTGAQEALLGRLCIAFAVQPLTYQTVRLLRMAAACQLVQQLPDNNFAHTKFSRGYAMDPGPGLAFNLLCVNTRRRTGDDLQC